MNNILITTTFIVLALSSLCRAGDWPQILGPQRNGIAEDESVGQWAGDLEIAWNHRCGSGFAGVAVVKSKVYLAHRIDDEVIVECLATGMGESVWRSAFEANYAGGYNADRGPRCVPVVDDGRVFCYSAGGNLHALNAQSGETLWTRELREELGAEDGYFGAGSTPIVAGGNVIVAVGGSDGGVVALDVNTGETRWTATSLEADYASPIAMSSAVVIFPMRQKTVALNTKNGKEVFAIDFGQRGLNVIGATPTIAGDKLLLTASYRIGAKLVDLSKSPPQELWKGDDVFSSQYNSGVVHNDFIYGIHGREDMGIAELRCVEFGTGRVVWRQEDYGVAHLIKVGDRLIIQKIDGVIELVAADDREYKPLSRFELPPSVYRAMPAFSGGVLFCRSTDRGQGTVYAIKLPSSK